MPENKNKSDVGLYSQPEVQSEVFQNEFLKSLLYITFWGRWGPRDSV